jgi:probable HAF family extracellular repeat protein
VVSLAALSLVLAAPSFSQQRYTITKLALPGGGYSFATGINAAGEATGYSSNATSSGKVHAFLYRQGKITDLGVLPGGTQSYGLAINSLGHITGFADSPKNSGYTHAFLYRNGKMTDISTLSTGTFIEGEAINDGDKIAGVTGTTGGQAAIYSAGKLTDLGALPGDVYSIASGLNNAGQAAGMSHTSTGLITNYHGFLYSGGKLTPLGTLPGGSQSLGFAINNRGQITGKADLGENIPPSPYHAVLITSGHMHDLGTLKGSTNSVGMALNNLGDVVGQSDGFAPYAQHAFLYNGTKMLDLNLLIPSGSGWTLLEATGINDAGQITGQGVLNGGFYGFLLTPAPQISDLVNLVQSMSLPSATAASLISRLNLAEVNGEIDCAEFSAFLAELQAQSVNHLTAAQSERMLAAVIQMHSAGICR